MSKRESIQHYEYPEVMVPEHSRYLRELRQDPSLTNTYGPHHEAHEQRIAGRMSGENGAGHGWLLASGFEDGIPPMFIEVDAGMDILLPAPPNADFQSRQVKNPDFGESDCNYAL